MNAIFIMLAFGSAILFAAIAAYCQGRMDEMERKAPPRIVRMMMIILCGEDDDGKRP